MSEPIWRRPDLPDLLAAELTRPAQVEWSRAFAPELVYGRHAGPAREDARAAAVAVVLCWRDGEWTLPAGRSAFRAG